jgi:hypothetical protein
MTIARRQCFAEKSNRNAMSSGESQTVKANTLGDDLSLSVKKSLRAMSPYIEQCPAYIGQPALSLLEGIPHLTIVELALRADFMILITMRANRESKHETVQEFHSFLSTSAKKLRQHVPSWEDLSIPSKDPPSCFKFLKTIVNERRPFGGRCQTTIGMSLKLLATIDAIVDGSMLLDENLSVRFEVTMKTFAKRATLSTINDELALELDIANSAKTHRDNIRKLYEQKRARGTEL